MTAQVAHIKVSQTGGRLHFARHIGEMTLAMWLGMPLGRSVFALIYGSGSDAAVREHDLAWTLLMAIAMTVPMVAVMLYRGHSRRSAGEMAVAMIAPALPFVALKLAGVISAPVAGPYMGVSMLAMIALMVYRRREYRHAAGALTAEFQS